MGEPEDPADDRFPPLGPILGLAAVSGFVVAIAVVAYLALEHAVSGALWEGLPNAFGWQEIPLWWVYAVLITGAVGVWGALRLPGRGGHAPLDGFSMDIGPKQIVSVLAAAMISLSVGAVLGPEAPLLALGSAVAAMICRSSRLQEHREVFMYAGAIAGLSFVLGNPLAAAVFVLESAVVGGTPGGKRVVTMLMTVMVATGFGYLIQVGVAGWGGVGESQLAVDNLPHYDSVRIVDLLLVVLVALVAAGLTVFARWVGGTLVPPSRRRPLATLLVGAALVATAASAASLISGEGPEMVLFSGQGAIQTALGITSVASLLVIGLAKTLAYGVSMGSGFRGGPVFPAVFVAIVIAQAFALATGNGNVSPLVAGGIAAATAAVVQLPFTSVLFAVLLCSGAGLAITTPAIIGSVIGVVVRGAADARKPPAGSHAPAESANHH